jgi:hypothetical protein
VKRILDEADCAEVTVATAKSHKYSLECFIRDMEPMTENVKDRPIADRVKSLLEHLMEGVSFLSTEKSSTKS